MIENKQAIFNQDFALSLLLGANQPKQQHDRKYIQSLLRNAGLTESFSNS